MWICNGQSIYSVGGDAAATTGDEQKTEEGEHNVTMLFQM